MADFTDTQSLDRANTITGFSGNQLILNRYRLVRVLGQGGMGVVWLARDEKLNRDIALKFLPDIVVNDRASLNDLIRETRRSLELTHPNIVRTYDFVQDNTVAGISMEYVDSDTLRNLRIDQPNGVFEPPQIAEWVKQLCGALSYAHLEAAIVHRDLKPANLMINGRGQLKVADFGIARSLVESISHMTMNAGGTSGTLVYMSPQQLSGETASALDDIYALGSTLYELCTTRPPFYSGDISGQVRTKIAPSIAQRRQSLSIPVADFPSNWEETIAACLAKDPAHRPQSALEVAVRLGLMDAAVLATIRPTPPPLVPATAGGVYPGGTAPTAPGYGTAPTATGQGFPTANTATLPAAVPMFPQHNRRKLYMIAGAAAAAVILIFAIVGLVVHNNNVNREQARLAAEKRAADARGGLFIATDPPGATVRVGDLPPVKSPSPIQNIRLGKQMYQIDLDGYDPATGYADIEENKVAQPATIVLAPSKGALRVQSEPAGLPYEIRSKATSLVIDRGTTPYSGATLPVGDYDITVTRQGYPPLRQIATVKRGQEETKVFEFDDGSLTINSEPPGAKVVINGKEVGVTPLHADNVTPGQLTFSLVLAGYDKATASGTIVAGEEFAPPAIELRKSTQVASTSNRPATPARHPSNNNRRTNRDDSSGHNSALEWFKAAIPYAPRH